MTMESIVKGLQTNNIKELVLERSRSCSRNDWTQQEECITDVIDALAINSSLESVVLTHINNHRLIPALSKLSTLKRVRIYNESTCVHHLAMLLQHCPIESLQVTRGLVLSTLADVQILSRALLHHPTLTQLTWHDFKVYNADLLLQALATTKLETLDWTLSDPPACKPSASTLSLFFSNPHLQDVTLWNFGLTDFEGFDIAHHPRLEFLSLRNNAMSGWNDFLTIFEANTVLQSVYSDAICPKIEKALLQWLELNKYRQELLQEGCVEDYVDILPELGLDQAFQVLRANPMQWLPVE